MLWVPRAGNGDQIKSRTRRNKMSAFHMHEMPKAKGEFLGFMVLAGSAANTRELLRRRELFGDGVRAGQKRLDWSLDNCKRQLSCLFKADEILNRLISAQEDPGRGLPPCR